MESEVDKITITLTRRAARFYELLLKNIGGEPNGPRGEVVDDFLRQIRSDEDSRESPFGLAQIHVYWDEPLPRLPRLANSWPDRNASFPRRRDSDNAAHGPSDGMGVPAELLSATTPPPAFWLVWREGGRFAENIPECRHFELAAANDEAERLAKKHPGVKFFVVPVRDYAVAAIMPVAWGVETGVIENHEVPF